MYRNEIGLSFPNRRVYNAAGCLFYILSCIHEHTKDPIVRNEHLEETIKTWILLFFPYTCEHKEDFSTYSHSYSKDSGSFVLLTKPKEMFI